MPPSPKQWPPLSRLEYVALAVASMLMLGILAACCGYCPGRTPMPELKAQGYPDKVDKVAEPKERPITFMEDEENDILCYFFQDDEGNRSNLSCVKAWKHLPQPPTEDKGDL